LVLVGPTATGKSDVALEAALSLGAEIVSADSRLVYRFMDVGTAKPNRAMRARVPHHLIDLVDPDRQYTSKDYERDARAAVSAIIARGRIPLVVGGTGLYVRALLSGIFEGPPANPALRARLAETARSAGGGSLWRRLAQVDPEKAARTDPHNLARVIRALEVFEATGEPMSRLEAGRSPLGLAAVKVGLRRATPDLNRLIDARVGRMLEAGLVDEVRGLVARGYGEAPAVKASLGYRETLKYLGGALSLDDAAALVRRHTRAFAKRQMTWFRGEVDIAWLDVTDTQTPAEVAAEVCREYLRKSPGGVPPGPQMWP